MKKSILSVFGVLSAVVIFAGAVLAAPAGQIEGGDIYRVRNVTKNGDFTDPATGTCGNTFQFKVRIHNPGPDAVNNVTVKATLPTSKATSHSSTITVSASNANPSSVSDTAGIMLDKAAKLAYVNGSTELLDANGSKLSSLGDTIFTSGVTISTVGVSVDQKRFVQFSVKTDCPTPPEKDIKVCDLDTKKIVTIKESDFDSNKHTKDLTKCQQTPPTPKTIKVCDLKSKEIVTINEDDFDSSRHTKDLAKCDVMNPVTPIKPKAPKPPVELPKTGPTEAVLSIIGLGALIASTSYYIRSRRVLS